jgi:hypothetical protein
MKHEFGNSHSLYKNDSEILLYLSRRHRLAIPVSSSWDGTCQCNVVRTVRPYFTKSPKKSADGEVPEELCQEVSRAIAVQPHGQEGFTCRTLCQTPMRHFSQFRCWEIVMGLFLGSTRPWRGTRSAPSVPHVVPFLGLVRTDRLSAMIWTVLQNPWREKGAKSWAAIAGEDAGVEWTRCSAKPSRPKSSPSGSRTSKCHPISVCHAHTNEASPANTSASTNSSSRIYHSHRLRRTTAVIRPPRWTKHRLRNIHYFLCRFPCLALRQKIPSRSSRMLNIIKETVLNSESLCVCNRRQKMAIRRATNQNKLKR